jgi:uncharacterized protein
MRIEVGKGLEATITDGTAGKILDSYLVPARNNYESTGNTTSLSVAFHNTAIALGQHIGYQSKGPDQKLLDGNSNISYNDVLGFLPELIVILIIPLAIVIMILVIRHNRRKGRRSGGHRRYHGGDSSGSAGWAATTYAGGGFSGGGTSGGGGAGR